MSYQGELSIAGTPADYTAEIYRYSVAEDKYHNIYGYRPQQVDSFSHTIKGIATENLVGPIYLPATLLSTITWLSGNDNRILESKAPEEGSYYLATNRFNNRAKDFHTTATQVVNALSPLESYHLLLAGWNSRGLLPFWQVNYNGSFEYGETYLKMNEKWSNGFVYYLDIDPMEFDKVSGYKDKDIHIFLDKSFELNEAQEIAASLHRGWYDKLESGNRETVSNVLDLLLRATDCQRAFLIRMDLPITKPNPFLPPSPKLNLLEDMKRRYKKLPLPKPYIGLNVFEDTNSSEDPTE